MGSPQKIPNASTDFVLSAIGEELGLLGTVAVCIMFLLLVGSGFRIAIQADRPFSKLFAAGVDIHGVHDRTGGRGRSLLSPDGYDRAPDAEKAIETAWESSPVAWVKP